MTHGLGEIFIAMYLGGMTLLTLHEFLRREHHLPVAELALRRADDIEGPFVTGITGRW